MDVLTISELTMCIEALTALDLEFGERFERSELVTRLREARERARREEARNR